MSSRVFVIVVRLEEVVTSFAMTGTVVSCGVVMCMIVYVCASSGRITSCLFCCAVSEVSCLCDAISMRLSRKGWRGYVCVNDCDKVSKR